ncbi:MAG: hypothetical protein KatS3mg105_3300 [Gemmatales bacterium]|nr:MAG: hypothetical protein KatS3mg105_3300 [Gemmatales bacterium]
MAAIVVEVADAVVEQLRNLVESQGGTIQRIWDVHRRLQDNDILQVDVVPTENDRNRADRSTWWEDVLVEVGIRRRVSRSQSGDTVDRKTMDGLVATAEQIAQTLQDNPVLLDGRASCLSVKIVPVYSPDDLDELRQFTSVVQATYRTRR